MTFSVFLTVDVCQTSFEKSTNTILRSSHMLRTVVIQLLSGVLLFVTPKDCSTPGLPVLHYLLKFAQVHVHCIGDARQPSHPLTPSFPFALGLSQHQGLYQEVDCSHRMTKILGIQL